MPYFGYFLPKNHKLTHKNHDRCRWCLLGCRSQQFFLWMISDLWIYLDHQIEHFCFSVDFVSLLSLWNHQYLVLLFIVWKFCPNFGVPNLASRKFRISSHKINLWNDFLVSILTNSSYLFKIFLLKFWISFEVVDLSSAGSWASFWAHWRHLGRCDLEVLKHLIKPQ